MIYDQYLQTLLGGLAIGCIYSLIALGISMIVRATDILHFAQGEVMMIGAMAGFTAGVWAQGSPLIALVGGTLGGGAMAVAVELGVYRPLRARRVPLINVVIATIAVSIVLQNVARLTWGSEPLAYPDMFGSSGISVLGFNVSPQLAAIVVLSVAIMAALGAFFQFSRAGIAMQAAAQDPDAARLMGISVERATVNTFAVSGMMAGAAGVLLGSLFFASFNMGFLTGIKAFVAAVLGGLGSVPGAMVGGLLFGIIETFSAMFISTSYKDAVGMVVLIVILLVAPLGLFGRSGRQV